MGWPPGSHHRGNDERKQYVCSGDFFGLFDARCSAYGQLSARSWWPASEEEWPRAEPYSFWGPAGAGMISNNRPSFPKPSAPALPPFRLEMDDAEVLINFPSFLSHPAVAEQRVNKWGPPASSTTGAGGLLGPRKGPSDMGPTDASSGGRNRRACGMLAPPRFRGFSTDRIFPRVSASCRYRLLLL